MAGPRIFVPGPSVNPSIGSPAQFLKMISDTSEGFARRRIADERTESDRLFKEATTALNERKQDFTEAAPQRAEDLRIAKLARDNEKHQFATNVAEGLQYAGGDRLTTLEDDLMKDPRYANLDDAGKLAARNQYILNNPSALTSPKKFASEFRQSLSASGKYTGAEIDEAVAQQISQRYPTADKSLVEKQLLKPKDLIASAGSGNVTIDGKLFSRGGGTGSFSTINDPTAPAQINQIIDDVASERGLNKNPSFLLGQRLDFEGTIPGTATDLTRQDLGDMASVIQRSGEVSSPTAMRAAMIASMTGEGNLREGFDWRTAAGQKKLVDEAKKAQASEERLLNKKGGGVSAAGQAVGVTTPADAAKAAAVYNERLLSGLVPRALSDQDVVSSFLDNLGAPAPVQTQTGKGDGRGASITPEVVDQPIVTPAPAVTPAAEAEFQVGGQVPAEAAIQRIFSEIADPRNLASANPIFGAALEGVDTAKNLIQSLTPPGPGVLGGGNAPAAPSPQQVRQANVDNLSTSERSQALKAARKLSSEGKIGLADGEGNSRDDSLLIAYFQYLEGQRN